MLNTGQAVALFDIANQCQLIGDISPFREYLKKSSLNRRLPTKGPSIQLSNSKFKQVAISLMEAQPTINYQSQRVGKQVQLQPNLLQQ
jgi:hypothetical protein